MTKLIKRVRSFTPSGSQMENKEFSFFSFNINFLKILIDLAFLVSIARLFHSLMQNGKKLFLNVFDLVGIGRIIVLDADLNG